MQISDDESKKSNSSFAESVESGEISASSSEWKMSSDESCVTCLNNSDKMAKPITNYLDLFINTTAGTFNTTFATETILKLPELNHSAEIYAICHLTDKLLNYNLILGRDILQEFE